MQSNYDVWHKVKYDKRNKYLEMCLFSYTMRIKYSILIIWVK